MNRALNIKNWKEGGNSYILKGNPKNKWVGFQQTVITQLREKFNDNFHLVIWTDRNDENDYYSIPFKSVRHLFTEEHKTTGKYENRWTAIIKDNFLLMHGNQHYSLDVSEFYAKTLVPESSIIIDEDYFIENAKAEINIRIGQSKFRRKVLENFNSKCAITGINEPSLLRASHIVPWSHKKNFRADVSNGIALYVELDALFDQGYFSLNDNYEVILTPELEKLSPDLKSKLTELKKRKLRTPKTHLKIEYLKYHRENILLT